MSEPKFTPGPWKYGRKGYATYDAETQTIRELPLDYRPVEYGCGATIFGANDEEIAGNDEYQVFNKPEDVALILAAPDLYYALETICRDCIGKESKDNVCDGCICGKALRKARGEER